MQLVDVDYELLPDFCNDRYHARIVLTATKADADCTETGGLQPEPIESSSLRCPTPLTSSTLTAIDFQCNFSPSRLPHDEGQEKSESQCNSMSRFARLDYKKDVFIALVDAALRTSIAPNPTRISRSISGSNPSESTNLAQFAAPIFCPGYISDVKARASLMPAISRAILSVTARAVAPGLSQDWQNMLCGNAPVQNVSEYALHDDEDRGKSLINAYLWLTATKALINVAKAKRLLPLNLKHDADAPELPTIVPEDLFEALAIRRPTQPENVFRHDISAVQLPTEVSLEWEDRESAEDAPREELEMLFDLYDACQAQRLTTDKPCMEASFEALSVREIVPEFELNLNRTDLLPESVGALDSDEVMLQPSCRSSFSTDSRTVRSFTSDYFTSRQAGLTTLVGPRVTQSPNEYAEQEEGCDFIGEVDTLTVHPIRLLPDRASLIQVTCTQPTSLSHTFPTDNLSVYNDLQDCLSVWSIEETTSSGHDRSTIHQDFGAESEHIDIMAAMDVRSKQPSLSDMLGGDHLMWHMWKRRASVAPREEDSLELHDMFAEDPDMKLIGSRRNSPTLFDTLKEDEEMLDTSFSTSTTNSPITPDSPLDEVFSNPFIVSSPRKASYWPTASAATSQIRQTTPRRQLSRHGSSFMKRLSISRPSSSGGNSSSSNDEIDMQRVEQLVSAKGRSVEIKRRKTLDDYHEQVDENDGVNEMEDEMILN